MMSTSLFDVATGKTPHLYAGRCPDSVNGPEPHDPDCPACQAIAAAEAALAEPKAHHQEPMTIRLDPNAPCRNALAREGKPYPKSNCQRCGTLMRPGWKCAEGVDLGKPPMRGCELRDDAVGVFKP